ncbi:MAG TPA: helix-turn-helix transcriptional regulator [Pyrinomonadaceae bacterium]|nr:helix-turn-helix transcriptional regulator [Pyrinomonadaceae bacterium]
MNVLSNKFKEEFQDKETRHIYADDLLNTFIATQLKVLREDREWTQKRLAQECEMRQERISVLEDVNYDSWSVKTLKRLAKAFDLRLTIKFESFGSFLKDFENFDRESLRRPSFEDDPAFKEDEIRERAVAGAPRPELGAFKKTSSVAQRFAGVTPPEQNDESKKDVTFLPRRIEPASVANFEEKKHGTTGS